MDESVNLWNGQTWTDLSRNDVEKAELSDNCFVCQWQFVI